ncbi:Pre-mRNA-splicing factor clf1 [Astathelohania contejeani]|uniref:Pre-mRNA-splicing factor clf1 n=1 Tax=Astathelohania contejeani TaxID=164912 RepID=A0ABQ7I133_9MICR|nr:Pre-mRNA-splicing factor clf1 [Thelohania contejeani]
MQENNSKKITADQLVQEAIKSQIRPMKKREINKSIIKELLVDERNKYESYLRKNKEDINSYIRYANFEELSGNIENARSVFERGIDHNYRESRLWIKYIEMEIRNKNINHCRNLYERVTYLLPKFDTFWINYIKLEKKDNSNVERIYEKWMKNGNSLAYNYYIRFNIERKNFDKCRILYDELLNKYKKIDDLISYCRFEEKYGIRETKNDKIESLYNMAVSDVNSNDSFSCHLPKYEITPTFVKEYFDFLIRRKHYELAEQILNMGIQKFKMNKKIVICKRIYDKIKPKNKYKNPKNIYDFYAWAEIINLNPGEDIYAYVFELIGDGMSIEDSEIYKNYVIFNVGYAMELECKKDYTRAEEKYKNILYNLEIKIQKSEKFKIGLPWIEYSKFLIRRMRLKDARLNYGRSIAISPLSEIYKNYIEMEYSLKEYDRCRKIYSKYINIGSEESWIEYAMFEKNLNEYERSKNVFELALLKIENTSKLLREYIELEKEMGNIENVIALYEKFVKVDEDGWFEYIKYINEKKGDTLEEIINRCKKHFEYTNFEKYKSIFKLYENDKSNEKAHNKLIEMAHKWKNRN